VVKVLTFIKRKSGMPVDEFQTYWRTEHPKVVTRLPGIRRYVQSHVLPASYTKREPVYDGIAEVWADDTDAFRAMTKSAMHPALIADEAKFIDRVQMGVIVTEDHVTKQGEAGAQALKGIELFTKKAELSVDAFQRYWRETHAGLAARIPGVTRYVVNATRASAYAAGRSPAYDGAALMWFASPDALKSAGAGAEYQALIADRANFLATAQPPFIMTREHVILA
jgi:uncharacterized protein (TIGR02118 family)